MTGVQLSPAASAFDSIATDFDNRFSAWDSVAAQRRAVRATLLRTFPSNGRVLEIGGGTGEDACWLAERGFHIVMTDASPAMVEVARGKLADKGSSAEIAAAEDLQSFAARHIASGGLPFDGAFSNFAPLNCVEDLVPVGRGLARLIRPGGSALLVLFGTFSPGEMLVETLCGRPGQALRRLKKSAIPARLSGRHFTVTYHRAEALTRAMQPWFRPVRRQGIGVFVPPSAAEPWISRHRGFLRLLEGLDGLLSQPLAAFGDHVLYHFQRTDIVAP